MFNKKSMVLYCGGGPSLAPNAPASPGAGGCGGSSGGGAHAESSDSPLPLRAAPAWGPNGFSEEPCSLIGGGAPRAGPLALIGPLEGAPRALIGPRGAPRPASLALPEGELDGCEPDSDDEEAAAASASGAGEMVVVPSPDASLGSLPSEPETERPGGEAARLGLQDELRKVTLEVVGRYLREAAHQGAKEEEEEGGSRRTSGAAGGGSSSSSKKFLQGLLSRFGATQGEAEGAAQALETLRRVGDSILEKHHLAFQGMLRKMEIKKEEDLKTLSQVAAEVFRDGIINWGRIVTLISFGAFVAKHLKSINQENSINTLTEIITDVLVTEKREWLISHNAWEGFVKFFHVEDIEGGIRNVLMTFAGVAGIGAGLAYMIR